ncbi:hypothetical protein AVEN_135307-1 [Araneus ventricosus]|uniref:Uncharacterized protein n=1 Tax=Araneus ventricosus TaxID=182803 RepID=A0A4Y2NAH1_ARAVE|nr:hypothetical protein AVEN_135307-1 [Araneus ventricosus]
MNGDIFQSSDRNDGQNSWCDESWNQGTKPLAVCCQRCQWNHQLQKGSGGHWLCAVPVIVCTPRTGVSPKMWGPGVTPSPTRLSCSEPGAWATLIWGPIRTLIELLS